MSRGAAGVLPALLLSFSVSLAAETQLTTAGTDLHPAWSPDGTTIVFDSNRSGNRDLWTIPSGGGTAVQLTTDTGLDQDPDWSPGSTHIAFSDDGDIWVIPAGGGAAVPIASGPGTDRFPAWSPDSTQIAYSDGDIWVVPSVGGTPVRLTTDPANDAHPTWSPDGAWIAFHSNRGGNNDIWAVPAAGGTPVQVTTDSGNDAAPDWSPDGMRLAFQSNRGGGGNEIWVIGAAGGPAVQITTAGGNAVQPDWGPGGEIVFTRGGNLWVFTFPSSDLSVTKTVDEPSPFEGDTVVFTVAARNDGPNDATLVKVQDVLPAGLVYQSHTETSGTWDSATGTWDIGAMATGHADTLTITATPDAGTAGTTIENTAAISSIYNADPDPGNDAATASVTVQIQLDTREKRLTTGGSDASPAWSPDGRFVAFDSNRSGKRALWTVPAVGGTPAPLTATLAASRQPDWSPGADAIVFSGENGRLGVDADLYRLELGGGGPGGHGELVLLEGAPAPETFPAWSPDGTKIAYAAADDIWTVPSAGGTPTQLTTHAAADAHPTWSADGSMIAFVSDRAGSDDIWVIPANGGAAVALTSGPSADGAPDWSPAGDRIAFRSDRAGSDDIWIVPLDGGEPGRVTDDPAADTDPDWAPNGSRFVFVRDGDLWVAGLPSAPGGSRVTTAPEAPGVAAIRIESLRPNPGRSTEVRWDVRAAGPVELAIYDVSGRLVRELVAGEMPAGRHVTRWNGRDRSGRAVPAGVYFVRLRTDGGTDSSKLTLLR